MFRGRESRERLMEGKCLIGGYADLKLISCDRLGDLEFSLGIGKTPPFSFSFSSENIP